MRLYALSEPRIGDYDRSEPSIAGWVILLECGDSQHALNDEQVLLGVEGDAARCGQAVEDRRGS